MPHVPTFTLGLLAAFAASLLINGGMVLQALDARQVPQHLGLRLSLLARLVRRRRWLAGAAIGYLGFPLQILALLQAPLVVVRPVLASGLLLLLLVGARAMSERVSRGDAAGVGGIVVGLGLLAWGAPQGHDALAGSGTVAAIVGTVAALSLAPYVLPARLRGGLTLMVCSGLGFAAANMAIKALTEAMAHHSYVAAACWVAVAGVSGTAATVGQMTAFQRRRAVEVVPITCALPNFVPIALAPILLHENWATASLGGLPFALGSVLLLVGTLTVARAVPVVRIAAAQAA